MRFYVPEEIDASPMKDASVGIVGYGPQARAQAKNLRDGGVKVFVGLRSNSASASRAKADGFEVFSIAEVAKRADCIHFLIPDEVHAEIFERDVRPHLTNKTCNKKSLVFSHGFSVHYKKVVPPRNVDVYMVAPKGVGRAVRKSFLDGGGVPVFVAVHQDASGTAMNKALAHVVAAFGRAPLVAKTSFQEETEADLFGEQSVLCGGLLSLVLSSFEALLEAGISAEAAYFECLYELRFIVDLLIDRGAQGLLEGISSTALKGAEVAVEEFEKNSGLREVMGTLLKRIRSGEFAEQLPTQKKTLNLSDHPIQLVHQKLRRHLR